MLLLVTGLAVFLGAHLFTRARGVRAGLIASIGEGPYKAAYSLVSIAGLVLIVLGWRSAPFIELWSPPAWTRHVTALLVLPAFILVIASHLPGLIRAKAKHPMLAGLKLWATAHLISNGDLASVLLFGSLLAYGVAARILLKRDERVHGAPVRQGSWQNDVIAVVIGVAFYGLFGAFLHPMLIGKPAFGG
ncbi:NnrU family protein [Methylopila sp. M107]|uniref:NnrU family protein n=1 Tax=Methylopila sp. M107 TaxID=1101190 RepID=UPI000375E03F|nr:NnrU family protein [Methylopila sp. M107]